jgi:hypothetical protein
VAAQALSPEQAWSSAQQDFFSHAVQVSSAAAASQLEGSTPLAVETPVDVVYTPLVVVSLPDVV